MNLLAPNGRPSKLTPEQYRVVRTDAFKKWFGDWEKLSIAKMKDPAMDDVTLEKYSKDVSKVLDENGEPLVVYHTVKEKYNGWTKFKTVNDGNEIGSHFGTLEQAQHVANNALVDNPKMFLCFLNIKNPLKVDDMGFWTANNFKFVFNKNKIQYKESGDFHGVKFIEVQDVYDALSSKNIDGLMYRNIYEGSGFSYSVFFPNQIKLADGTNATFEGSNPDIRFNNGGLAASNGKKSNLNAEQYKLVRTKAFKDWFGDWENDPANASKVVDENGEPLVVYRGWSSNKKFGNAFNYKSNLWGGSSISSRKANRFGFYFTSDRSIAEIYANDFAQAYNDELDSRESNKERAKPILQEYFVNAKRVCDISPSNKDFPSLESKISDVQKVMKQKTLQDIKETETFNYTTSIGTKSLSKIVGFKLNNIQSKANDLYERRFQSNYPFEIYSYMINDGYGIDVVLKDALIENKYDGVRFQESTHYYSSLSKKQKIEFDKNEKKGVVQNYPFVYVAFDSNQIKLADGTNATFDGSNPDIRFNNGGEVDKSVLKDFSNNIEAYQSNHYGSFNRDKLVEIYMSLPISVKQKIQPPSTKNLFRGADGFDSKKSAISFTKNKDYAKFFGAYTIPFSVIEKYEGLIDTRKLSNYLYDLGIQNEIGDDEGEVIVINPIFKKDLEAKIENYRYEDGGLVAPNGKKSNLNAKQYKLVRTQAFKDWFGDWENDPANASKVVDENGEPLVVYHGTSNEFTIFKKDRLTIGVYGQGFYFTNDKGFASNYAKSEGSKILTCFLNVKNIFEIDNDQLPIGYEKYSNMDNNKGISRDFTIKLKSLSYDGILAKNRYNENELVVFEPNQIKLADGSNTTFDSNNPDIRFNNGGLAASNGKKSNLNAEQYKLVRTKAFKDWFGDWENDPANASKVVDENGEPMVVYHRSPKKFTIFDKDKIGNSYWKTAKFGFYFSNKNEKGLYGNKVYKCFLNLREPYDIEVPTLDHFDWRYADFDPFLWEVNRNDGLYIKINEVVKNKSDKHYVVFEPNQIKLADGTNVTFDGNNPDIRFNNGGNVKTDFNDYENSSLRKAIVSFWNDFTNSEIANYLGIGKEDYIIDNERGVFVITRNNKSLSFSNVEKQKFQNWIAPYLDTKRKKDIAKYFLDYSIVDNIIIIRLSLNEMYNNGGKMKSVSNGTITVGASHDDGGIPVYNKGTGQMLEVEGGEGIINKRSMALTKEVTLNGDKMTPCEAASEINQMAGGVAYNCDNAKGSKETYNNGGEFKKGRKMEAEHKPTLDKLYQHEINPKEAVDEIVKEHLSENPKYYSTEGKWTPARRKKAKYSREKKYFDMGGMSEDFDFGLGSLDSFVNSKISPADRDTPEQEIIDWTITKGRELLDTDILQDILKNIDAKWKPYFMTYQTFNLYKLGWRLQFGSSRQWAGLCSWDGKISKNIYLSIQFVKHDKNWQQNAIDTIQHEIAHACVTEGIISKVGQAAFNMIDPMYAANTGHGDSWKSICQAINLKGDCSVFYSNSDLKPSFRPFKYECVNCRDKGYGNKWGFTSNCFKCFKPVVVTKNI
jgi:hypothetical protein